MPLPVVHLYAKLTRSITHRFPPSSEHAQHIAIAARMAKSGWTMDVIHVGSQNKYYHVCRTQPLSVGHRIPHILCAEPHHEASRKREAKLLERPRKAPRAPVDHAGESRETKANQVACCEANACWKLHLSQHERGGRNPGALTLPSTRSNASPGHGESSAAAEPPAEPGPPQLRRPAVPKCLSGAAAGGSRVE